MSIRERTPGSGTAWRERRRGSGRDSAMRPRTFATKHAAVRFKRTLADQRELGAGAGPIVVRAPSRRAGDGSTGRVLIGRPELEAPPSASPTIRTRRTTKNPYGRLGRFARMARPW